MKIIGTRDNGYIVDIGHHELRDLIQVKYSGDRSFKVGDELKVDHLYRQLEQLHRNKRELGAIIAGLRVIADYLEPKIPIIENLTGETDGTQAPKIS